MTTEPVDVPGEVLDGVVEAAKAARAAVRHVDHPDNESATMGMSEYAFRAAVAAAYAAGQESVFAGGGVQLEVQGVGPKSVRKTGDSRGGGFSVEYAPSSVLMMRAVGPWMPVEASLEEGQVRDA